MSRFGLGFIGTGLNDTGDATATLSGTAAFGNTLTCTFNNDDPDGAATGITYQWFRDASTSIGGATSSTYPIVIADEGHTLRCQVSYTDGKGFSESITTANSATVGTAVLGTLTYRGVANTNNSAISVFTFAGCSIGTASADRWVFVSIAFHNNVARTLNGVTIGGVTAFVETVAGSGSTSNAGQVVIASALVPTGTTADIVCTFNANFTATTSHGCGINWYTVTGQVNQVAADAYDVSTNVVPTKTFATVAKNGGFVIAVGVPTNVSHGVTGDLTIDDNFVQYVASGALFAGHFQNTSTSASASCAIGGSGWTNTTVAYQARQYNPN